MIIVHGFHNYYPFVGGMERVVQGLAEAQVKLGHEVHIITSKYGASNHPSNEILNNVNIHRIQSCRILFPDITIPQKIPTNLLKNADIVHVHAHNSIFSQKILKKANDLKLKTACYFMGVNALQRHPNYLVRTLAPYYGSLVTNNALKRTNVPFVKSIKDLNILKGTYGIEPYYLPDALDDSIFQYEKADPNEFRVKFGIKQANFFLFIGRLHKLKGPQILIEAMKYVKDVAAVFIGPDDGYLRETLRLAENLNVRNRIYVLNYVDEITKIKAIDSSIALVNSSIADHVEIFSVVVSEAWAREKPVIASNVGELAYRVKPGINGLLVDPLNPKQLAKAMMELICDQKSAHEMGKNGLSSVSSWKNIAKKSIELYGA